MALVLKVHPSNYRVEGFTEAVRRCGSWPGSAVPVVVDIGSGLLDAACPWLLDGPPAWLAGEPAARQTLAAGAALVTFSGDKLLGGPQAGIIAGRADLVARCAAHPLARALRPGGLVLGALQDVALAYLRRDGRAIPFWRMATDAASTSSAAGPRRSSLASGDVGRRHRGAARRGVAAGTHHPLGRRRARRRPPRRLRALDPPVIARVQDGRTILDLRDGRPADDHAPGRGAERRWRRSG